MNEFFRSRIPTTAIVSAALSFLSSCAVTGSYPSSWPELAPQHLVGKCPDIAGWYENVGASYPAAARQLTLSQILGVGDGDGIEIRQSPDAIVVVTHRSGEPVEEAAFSSAEVRWGWATTRPRTFLCPYDVLSGRVLYFSHEGRTEIGGVPGVPIASWEGVRFKKARNGSLIVLFEQGTGALLVLVPVGKVDKVWYQFSLRK